MAAIGVFDSGMGGISVLRRAASYLPNESFIYYGDNKNAPYGNRGEAEIRELTLRSARELLKYDIKALLIACNTATAAAFDCLTEQFEIPVTGTQPAILGAEGELTGGVALMMATEATTALPRYRELRKKLVSPEKIIDVPCPTGIVKKIERGELSGFKDILTQTLLPYAGLRVDVIVLGCTHYPLISREIRAVAGELFSGGATLRDAAEETARSLKRALHGNLAGENAEQKISFLTSGNQSELQIIFDKLLKAPI